MGSSCWTVNFKTTIIIIAVIFVAPYLTDKGEHTTLYQVNNNVYIKTSKLISYIVIILYPLLMHVRTHTHKQVHRRNVTREGRQVRRQKLLLFCVLEIVCWS